MTLSVDLAFEPGATLGALCAMRGRLLGGALPAGLPKKPDGVAFPAVTANNISLSAVCALEAGGLTALYLYPSPEVDSEALCSLLSLPSAPQDADAPVTVSYPFGTVTIARDPRTGRAYAFIRYQ